MVFAWFVSGVRGFVLEHGLTYDEFSDFLATLERSACERFQLGHCAIVHRLGLVPVTEASVAVVTSAPHRGAAFDAARWVMDELKRSVPIWKKEHFDGGDAQWAKGHPLPPA